MFGINPYPVLVRSGPQEGTPNADRYAWQASKNGPSERGLTQPEKLVLTRPSTCYNIFDA